MSVLLFHPEKLWNQRFFCIYGCVRVSCYIKGVRKLNFYYTIAFLDTHLDKAVKLQYFWANITLLSQMHWWDFKCVFLVARCNIIGASRQSRKEKLIYRLITNKKPTCRFKLNIYVVFVSNLLSFSCFLITLLF